MSAPLTTHQLDEMQDQLKYGNAAEALRSIGMADCTALQKLIDMARASLERPTDEQQEPYSCEPVRGHHYS